jgi:hypothetical protein
MFRKGSLGNINGINVYEAPSNMTHRTVEKMTVPTVLENQSANILFRLFNPAPSCRIEIKEEQVAYLINTKALWGLGSKGLFADKGVIASMMQYGS